MLVRMLRGAIVAAACLAVPAGALAADLPPRMLSQPGLCIFIEPTPLLALPVADLRGEVERRYVHAVETAERSDIVYSSRPAFNWALETRFSCGKAIGYLKARTVHDFEISKCDCFYQRMVRFMP